MFLTANGRDLSTSNRADTLKAHNIDSKWDGMLNSQKSVSHPIAQGTHKLAEMIVGDGPILGLHRAWRLRGSGVSLFSLLRVGLDHLRRLGFLAHSQK